MGKSTNKLEEIVAAEQEKNVGKFTALVNELYDFHIAILGELFTEKHFKIYNEIEGIFEQIRERFHKPFPENYSFEYDQIVSLGEVISSKIISAYLFEQGFSSGWADSRELVRTNNQYQEGKVDWEKTEELVKSKLITQFSTTDIVITQGFVGHTPEGFTTTLGREGSDYTAGIYAYCSDAESVTIWKDVPGMLNADPKYFSDTVKLDQISFKEAIELSYYGASVIHPKTVQPLQQKDIPLYVKSFLDPEALGTTISSSASQDAKIPSFIVKKEQLLLTISSKDFSFIAEQHLSDIFETLAQLQIPINIMQNSALNFSILVDRKKVKLESLREALGTKYQLRYNEGL
jgi:aspartate kinase